MRRKHARKLRKRFNPADIVANFDVQKRLSLEVAEAILDREYRLLSEKLSISWWLWSSFLFVDIEIEVSEECLAF